MKYLFIIKSTLCQVCLHMSVITAHRRKVVAGSLQIQSQLGYMARPQLWCLHWFSTSLALESPRRDTRLRYLWGCYQARLTVWRRPFLNEVAQFHGLSSQTEWKEDTSWCQPAVLCLLLDQCDRSLTICILSFWELSEHFISLFIDWVVLRFLCSLYILDTNSLSIFPFCRLCFHLIYCPWSLLFYGSQLPIVGLLLVTRVYLENPSWPWPHHPDHVWFWKLSGVRPDLWNTVLFL